MSVKRLSIVRSDMLQIYDYMSFVVCCIRINLVCQRMSFSVLLIFTAERKCGLTNSRTEDMLSPPVMR